MLLSERIGAQVKLSANLNAADPQRDGISNLVRLGGKRREFKFAVYEFYARKICGTAIVLHRHVLEDYIRKAETSNP